MIQHTTIATYPDVVVLCWGRWVVEFVDTGPPRGALCDRRWALPFADKCPVASISCTQASSDRESSI